MSWYGYGNDPSRDGDPGKEPSRNIYDLLRTLIEKVQWSSESEKLEYLEFVTYAQQLRAFGDGIDISERKRS